MVSGKRENFQSFIKKHNKKCIDKFFLSASMCDRLWGIDKNGTLLRHTQLGVSLLPGHGTPTTTHSYQLSSTGMEEDWEVL